MSRRRIRAHYEQLSEFERRRIIGLNEGGWVNWRIARHTGRSDAAIRRCWKEWVGNGRFQCITALDSSLSIIRRATRTRVPTMNIHRRLIQWWQKVLNTLIF
ncbi:HTH_Tnp_Tc3_2 domain-containing protein [Trichonephila clavipes]|nr:HTH_Tnp_Tc3_2 domain-containing protein [Trichonephila clavipes]